jgi:hypothetical protein
LALAVPATIHLFHSLQSHTVPHTDLISAFSIPTYRMSTLLVEIQITMILNYYISSASQKN